jgi:hypothetical protein
MFRVTPCNCNKTRGRKQTRGLWTQLTVHTEWTRIKPMDSPAATSITGVTTTRIASRMRLTHVNGAATARYLQF